MDVAATEFSRCIHGKNVFSTKSRASEAVEATGSVLTPLARSVLLPAALSCAIGRASIIIQNQAGLVLKRMQSEPFV
jgi:hypothetical protein